MRRKERMRTGKILTFCTMVMLGVACITTTSKAADLITEDGFTYQILDGTDTVEIKKYTGDASSITVPNQIEGKEVVSLSKSAFAACSSLESVDCSGTSIAAIPDQLFSGSVNLREVKLPESVLGIGYRAFYQCKSLEKITFPDSMEYIKSGAFMECTGLKEVVMSKQLVSIETSAFSGCTSLETMDLSNTSVMTITDQMFNGCESLTEVRLPETVLVIGKRAFLHCEQLEKINLPEGLRSIAFEAFAYGNALRDISLPDSLDYLGGRAFYDCTALESVSIPEGITVLQEGTFDGAYQLKQVYLPDSLRIIQKKALQTVDHYSERGSNLTSIYIPASVECIGEDAFPPTKYMSTIVGLPDSFAKDYAQQNGYAFTEIAENAKIIFDACVGELELTEKTVVKGQEYGKLPVPEKTGYTFAGWYADETYETPIQSITLVERDSITVYAKWEQTDNSPVEYKGSPSDFTIKDGVLTKYSGYQSVVVVPDGVTEIKTGSFGVFEDQSTITTLVLPESLTKIGSSTFEECTSLLELVIPEGVTEIPKEMCYNCTNLKKVVIPEGVTQVGEKAFASTGDDANPPVALQDIILPDKLESIGDNAFANNTNLMGIDLPEGITEIGNSAFKGCNALKRIAIPASVAVLNSQIFDGCDSLEDIVLTDGLQQFQSKVLYNTPAVTTLYIPESVKEINDNALLRKESTATSFVIEGMKDSAAYTYYEEKIKTGTVFSGTDVSFRELTYDSTIEFDSQISGMEVDSKKAIVGKAYGVLPVLEQDGKVFKGWSFTQNGTSIVKSTNLVEEESVKLYAMWENLPEEVPEECEEDAHKWDEGVVTKEPSATETGIRTYTCTVCAQTKTEEIAATGETPDQPENPGGNETPDQPENPGGNETPDQPGTPEDNGNGGNGGTTTPPAGNNTNPPEDGSQTETQSSTPAPAAVGTKLIVAASSCEVRVVSSDATAPAVVYTGTSNASAKTIQIPDTVAVDGITYRVTSVAPNAFKGNKKLKSVIVGKNVTTIGKSAFENCKNLKKITIKSTKLTKKSIGKNALKGTGKKLVIKVPKKQLKDYKKYFKNKGSKIVIVKK